MPYNAQLAQSLKSAPSVKDFVRAYLSEGEAQLRSRHLAEKKGAQICASYAALIDELLKALFAAKGADAGCALAGCALAGCALVALGGYGRSELNIKSDVDLMLLYGRKITPEMERLTQEMLYVLWDTGLDVGFSIRSLEESLALAKEDLKTRTALLDARFLSGDAALYDALVKKTASRLFEGRAASRFIDAKIEETRERHVRFGGSVYILEPNIKEGEGGLRDFHTAVWIVKARHGQRGIETALEDGIVTRGEWAELTASVDFLLWVRNELHFAVKRKTDQMTFDHQERIAGVLGHASTERMLAVEAFMQRYYRHASAVNGLSGLMQSRCLHKNAGKGLFWPRKKVRIDRCYAVVDNMLTVRDKDAFALSEDAAINAFVYSQAFGVELNQETRDLVLRYPVDGGTSWRSSPVISAAFLKILKGANVYKTLSEMHRLKFLERYIPEFGEITCRVQHDLYHVYTVDAHTLFAVRELERLRGEYKANFSLLSTLFGETPNPEVLTLAVLLHDIGKAAGKGHAEHGAEIARGICKRLNLPEDSASLVRFLVRNHLCLADTAQYRDIHDEKLVIEFAKKVGDIERLNLLYLLTFADVRAVGPDVWSQWKGALFQELYFKALTVIERGTFEAEDVEARLRAIRDKVLALIKQDGTGAGAVEEYFGLLPQRYFLTTSPDFVADHIRILRGLGTRPYVFTTRQDRGREYTEFVVCTHDTHGLFSMITGVMSANAVNILGAQINTLKNGLVLDVLQVTSHIGELIVDEAKLKKIERDLADVLTGKVKVASLAGRRKASILDRKAKPRVATRVETDNEVSDAYTVLDIHAQNRIGLLYDITSAITRLGLYIHVSKIATKGDEAADIFYVKDIFGQKVYYTERLREISSSITKAIDEKA
ncbi:MAG: [protein-PII] uridylyltransferase [Deltaproteobacteria bacterium]|nr:[protein-PII] uridylyltransferase [Deltaproteobacteria bacterium]